MAAWNGSRWCLALTVSVSVGACGPAAKGIGDDTSGATGTQTSATATDSESGSSGAGETGTVLPPPGNRADILLVVSNVQTFGDDVGGVARQMASLIGPLEAAGTDYRIAVTTTDTGHVWCSTQQADGALRVQSCLGRLEDFILEMGAPPGWDARDIACRDFCELDELVLLPTTTRNDDEPKVRPWLEPANLPAGVAMADALACVVPQGIEGCVFTSPLEAMHLAMARMEDPQDPAYDFRRDDSVFAVVFATDRIDCSHQLDEVFDPQGNRHFWTDPDAAFPTLGACWNAGVRCDGGPGTYETCEPEDWTLDGEPGAVPDAAAMHPVSRYIDQLTDLGQHVVVGGVAGVSASYGDGAAMVFSDGEDPTFVTEFGIGPGCQVAPSNPVDIYRSAIPPVRLMALESVFGDEQMLGSICSDDHAGALGRVAQRIVEIIEGGGGA